jgi:hypothetical protein
MIATTTLPNEEFRENATHRWLWEKQAMMDIFQHI